MDQGMCCFNVGSVLTCSYSGGRVPLCRWAMRFLNKTPETSLGFHWTVWNAVLLYFHVVFSLLSSLGGSPFVPLAQLMNCPALLWFLLSSISDSSAWQGVNFGGISVTRTVFNNYFHLNSHVVRMKGAQLATVFLTIWFGFKCGFIPLPSTHFVIIC